MSGDGNTKHTEDYLTLHPWSGDNGSHEDWEKVLSLKALSPAPMDASRRPFSE